MDDDFLTKMLTLGLWLVVVVLVFVIGVPLAHAVSVVDTACFQATQMAQTGSESADVVQEAQTVIESQMPTQLDGTVLFDPAQDIQVVDLGQGQEKISVIYEVPVFGPIVRMFGFAGPTLPVTDTKTVTVSSVADEWVPYSQ
ncbi:MULTISPECIES: hypothetical protein [Alicyclobacillus]|uniref:hypothetical protein n=1 Tax=Alicyclobacillus TaxID=29330 RepID=UPI00082EC01C|nr:MULTISPECIES: hypothetical protein [Alicyclobacillus]